MQDETASSSSLSFPSREGAKPQKLSFGALTNWFACDSKQDLVCIFLAFRVSSLSTVYVNKSYGTVYQ